MTLKTLDSLPELMSIEEAAQYLNVCRATMYNWTKKGDVPSIKIGNTRRIRKGELEQVLNNNETIKGV